MTASPETLRPLRGAARFYATLFPLSLVVPALFLLVGLVVFVRGLSMLVIGPDEFWGYAGLAAGCVVGSLASIRGTLRSYRQIEGARELVLEGLVNACSQPWGKKKRGGYIIEPPTNGSVEAIRTALQQPGLTWLDLHELRFGVVGLLALGLVALSFGVLSALGPLLASAVGAGVWSFIIWPIFACMVAVIINLPQILWMARYLPARWLVRRRGGEAELSTPAETQALPPGLGPKLRVLGIGCFISSVLMLLGVWRMGSNVLGDIGDALLAGLAVALPGSLAAWPAFIGRRDKSPATQKSKSSLAGFRDALWGTGEDSPRRQWGGWETVMEDPGWNWFDYVTAAWIVLGLGGMAVLYTLVRFSVILVSQSIKYSLFHLVALFVIQGLLFAYARHAIYSARLRKMEGTPDKPITLGDWMRGVTVTPRLLLVLLCLAGLVGFFIAFPKLPTVRLVREIAVPTGDVRALTISADGTLALTGEKDGSVRLWDLETGTERRLFGVASPQGADQVALSLDGRLALAARGAQGGGIVVWDVQTGQELHRLEEEGFYPPVNGTYLLTHFSRKHGESWETVQVLRDLTTGAKIRQIEPNPDYRIGSAILSRDGQQMLLSYESDNEAGVRLWEVGTCREIYSWRFDSAGRRSTAAHLAFVPGKNQVMAIDRLGNLFVWDANTGQRLVRLRRFDESASGWYGITTAVFAEGRYAAVLTEDRDFRLYDLTQGKLVYTGDLPHERARFMAGSADGRRVITCGWHGGLCLWELPERQK